MFARSASLLVATYVVWRILKWVRRPVSHLEILDGPPSPSWLIGHMQQLYDKQSWQFHRDLHTKYGPVFRMQHMFGRPMLCVYDPLAMYSIVVKDQHIYGEIEMFTNFALDSFGPGIIATTGETHRKQRRLLTPIFSTKNLRRLTPVFYEVVARLKNAINTEVESGAPDVDVAQYMGRTALETIGKAALGYSFDPLTEDHHDAYADAVKSFVPATGELGPFFLLYPLFRPLIPKPLRRPLAKLLPSQRVKRFLDIVDTMHSSAIQLYSQKKRDTTSLGAGPGENEEAHDLLTILLQANEGAPVEDKLPEEELIAQLSSLAFVATDTTSSALNLIFKRLAENLQAQEKLRAELQNAKSRHADGHIPYDELMSLPYLEAVVRETLRVDVPAQLRMREARVDAVLPLSKPIQGKDGSMMDSVPVPKGTIVFVAIQAANVSKDLWGPDALEWRPERWLEPLPETVTEAKIPGVYSNLMTFWGGGRSCIGFKFAQLEIKAVLAELLSTFKFENSDAQVVWNMADVVHPTVGDSPRPSYPMKVTRVDSRMGAMDA
ncbi:cytochrome P450 [Trametes sanguinea]|nr:cytochrome P450 [Trametes sanguinea]